MTTESKCQCGHTKGQHIYDIYDATSLYTDLATIPRYCVMKGCNCPQFSSKPCSVEQEKVEAVTQAQIDALQDSISNWGTCYHDEGEAYPLANYLIDLGYSLPHTLPSQGLLLTREEWSKITGLSVDAEYMYNAALPELKAQLVKVMAWRGK